MSRYLESMKSVEVTYEFDTPGGLDKIVEEDEEAPETTP